MTDAARWHEFVYEQTDIPAGMTVREWRIDRARTRAPSRHWSRIVGALGRSALRPVARYRVRSGRSALSWMGRTPRVRTDRESL